MSLLFYVLNQIMIKWAGYVTCIGEAVYSYVYHHPGSLMRRAWLGDLGTDDDTDDNIRKDLK